MTPKRVTRTLAAIAGALCGLCLGVPSPMAAETIQTGMIGAPNAAGWVWYVGIEKGFFSDAGINLDLIYVPTASGLVQQLAAGSLDIVGDVGVAKPDIASIKELKGKTICIGGLIDINRVYLDRIMKAAGLADGEYDMTVIG